MSCWLITGPKDGSVIIKLFNQVKIDLPVLWRDFKIICAMIVKTFRLAICFWSYCNGSSFHRFIILLDSLWLKSEHFWPNWFASESYVVQLILLTNEPCVLHFKVPTHLQMFAYLSDPNDILSYHLTIHR